MKWKDCLKLKNIDAAIVVKNSLNLNLHKHTPWSTIIGVMQSLNFPLNTRMIETDEIGIWGMWG